MSTPKTNRYAPPESGTPVPVNVTGEVAVSVVGMENVVVVVSSDGVLVVPKDRAQDVRDVVGVLKERGSKHI